MITQKNYINRRAKLVQLSSQPLIIISGADLVQQSSDQTYEFGQDGYFYYLTGIDEPGWRLVIDIANGREFLFSIDPSSYHDEVWEVKLDNKQVAQISGISEIKDDQQAWGYLKANLASYKSLGSVLVKSNYDRDFGMFTNPAKLALIRQLKKTLKSTIISDISPQIRSLRSIKEIAEIAEIKKAISISNDGLQVIRNKLATYNNERQIYADLAQSFISVGSQFANPPVIASGSNAATLHYGLNNSDIQQNSFLLIDVGAVSNHYKADISRTYSIGKPSKRHQDIYRAVEEVQSQSLDYLKAGVTMREHELFVEQLIGKSLNKLGVIKTMNRNEIRKYYPHGVSHHLGIDVHDSCDYQHALQPGSVITVEPGIYLPKEGIGVRLEDDVLVTANGIEILSKRVAR